jgi:PAS domain S-box-containing protein
MKREDADLKKEVVELREKVRELEETLDAIRSGEVDAIVVSKGDVHQVYTLEGTDHPYQALIENIREGALTLSRTGMILYTNTQFAEMVQVSPDKVPGTTILDYICPDHRMEIEEALREIVRRACRIRVRIRHGSSSLPVLISMNPLSSDEDTKISVVVTDRRKDDAQLRLQGWMLNAVGDAVIATDTDEKIIYWNAAATKTYGWKPDEMMGHVFADVATPEISNDEAREIAARFMKGETWAGEYFVRHRDGHVFPIYSHDAPVFDDDGKLIAIIRASHDISEQKRVEKELRKSEERFHLALRNAPVSVAIQDKNLVFQWAYSKDTLGSELVRGKSDIDLYPPEDAAQLTGLKRKVLETGKKVNEKIWLKTGGRQLYVDLYLEPMTNQAGQINGIGIAMVDLTEQKRADDALRQNEENLNRAHELLEAVTKGTDVIIAVQDTDFRYIFFNQTYKEEIKRLTGKDLTLGASMIDLYADIPGEQKRTMDEWRRVLSGESVNQVIEFNEAGKPGRVYHVLHTPLRDAHGNIVGAGEVAFDVTKQVQVEEKLRETKEYLDNLITYANAPIMVWDPQFHITLFNRAFEHLTGRKAKDVLGQPVYTLLPGKCVDEALDLIKKTTLEGERWDSVEIPILHKKGEIRTVLWNSASIFGVDGKTIVSTIAQGQDITDRKRIEAEYRLRAVGYANINVTLNEEIRQRKSADTMLKKALSLLSASLESTADGIYVVDPHGNITSYNQNFMNLWNITPDLLASGENEGVIKYVLPQLTNPDEFIASLKDLDSHPGRESFDMIEFKDGKIIERYSKPQKIGNTVVGRVWSFRDVTDRKHAEEKLVASVQEKEVLLREIHHRVKNNLQLVSGLLDMTRMRSTDEATTGILTDMMLKIQTMAQIHTRLYESKQFGRINITEQCRDQVTALANIYSHKGHEINCELNSPEVFLPVDLALPCALVVNELLSNAYKHAFVGRKKGTIKISVVQEDGKIHIAVLDNGVGIPENFDIYHSNSLGLKLIRTLVQHQLKGTLMINSQHGTEIIVEFPNIPGGT